MSFGTIMQLILLSLIGTTIYLAACLLIILLSSKIPRNPIRDLPDWGKTHRLRIPTVKNKTLEGLMVVPHNIEISSDDEFTDEWKQGNPAIILIHGWGRNQGRMVSRARIYGKHGFTTILFSVRDHGESDREITGMNIRRFSEDITSVIHWWGGPVFLAGHSIGGGAALLVAAEEPSVRGVIAEAPPYALPQSMKYIMRPGLGIFTPFFIPGLWLIVRFRYFRYHKHHFSPLDAAPLILSPVLLIHGTQDSFFPFKHSSTLHQALPNSRLWVVKGGNHYNLDSDSMYESTVIDFISSCLI
ncbi:MAG: alpha/beta hydrolase [Candidatus Heimdallarchaeota archaeon]